MRFIVQTTRGVLVCTLAVLSVCPSTLARDSEPPGSADSGDASSAEDGADDGEAAQGDSEGSPSLHFDHEIVVTARRVEEDLQDVPTAVSAYPGDDLATLEITAPSDLVSRVPSLQFYEFNIGLPHFFIRGIGSVNRSGASDPAVGLFVDDVYIPRGYGPASDFFDLESVEVMRGPQGTLFGRNVVGGAVVLRTREPTADSETSVSTRIGNNGRRDLRAIVNRSLAEGLFIRLAAQQKNYDGHAFNTLTRRHLEDQDHLSVRVGLKALPVEGFDLLLRADRERDDGLGNWWHLGAEGPLSVGNGNPEPRRGPNPFDGLARREDWGVAVRATWDHALGTTTAVSSYRNHDYEALDNTTGLLVAELDDPERFRFHHTLFVQGQHQTSRSSSHELRWASPRDRRVVWLAGLFYLDEDVRTRPTTRYRFIFFDSEGEFGFDARNRVTSFALFGQAEYTLGTRLRVAAGLRSTEDRKEHRSRSFGEHFFGFTDLGQPVEDWTVETRGRWSNVTPLLSLSYVLTESAALYGTISKGFKSGGFNDEGAEKALVATPFEPETAWNYEIGVKAQLWDRRCRLNASVFYLDYRDLQVEQFVQPDPELPPFEVTTNAGASVIQGVELEWDVRLLSRLSISGSYSYLHTRISDLVHNGNDISGNQLPYAPENILRAGLGYQSSSSRRGTVAARLGFAYNDPFFGDIGNSDVIRLGDRELLDAGVEWLLPGSRWSIRGWGKNLTDKLYALTATEVPLRDRYEKFGEPRSYGVTVTYRR